MKQTSREKYLSQKKFDSKTRKKVGTALQNAKKPLAPFEKLVLFLLLIFVISIPLALLINKDIMIYVGLINYFILGLAITVKPELVINIMRKNNARFEEIYGKRFGTLITVIRGLGILFLGIGAYFYYFFVFRQA